MEDHLTKVFNQADIEKYINLQAEESLYLEFKSADALRKEDKAKKEITKDISSFANSDGGILIYGILEKEHKASAINFINGDEFTKEWLEQVINSGIHRKIHGLVIEPIRFNGDIDKTIYIVKVPSSLSGAHMNIDGKYYKRYNFQSVQMEEYEVRNLYSQQDRTILEIDNIQVDGYGDYTNPLASAGFHYGPVPPSYLEKYNNYVARLQFDIKNAGRSIEKHWKTELWAPLNLLHTTNIKGQILPATSRECEEYDVFSIPNNCPLFQEEITTIEVVNIKFSRSSLSALQELPFIIKLFYSNGIEEISIKLLDLLNDKLSPNDFQY